MPFAVFVISNRKILYVNDAVETVFGWKRSQLINKSVSLLYRSEKEYEEIGKIIYSRLKKEKVISETYPAKHKSGKELLANITISRLHGRGEMDVVAIYEDVTDKMNAEKELRENEEKYMSYIENTHDILFSLDISGRFLSCNNVWRQAFGFSDEEIKKLLVDQLVDKEKIGSFKEILKEAYNNKAVLNKEISFKSKNGEKIIVIGNLIPRVFYGNVVSIGCFCHNITATRRAEQEIREKIDELEKFKKLTIDRELKMIELKEKVRNLEEKITYLQRDNA